MRLSCCCGIFREVWNCGMARLDGTFDHPGESHGVQALLQDRRLIHTGSERARGIEHAARESLMLRHGDDDWSGE